MSETVEYLKLKDARFFDAALELLESMQYLLDTIDSGGLDDDYQIEQSFGENILNAYLRADHAVQDFEIYFDEETESP